MRYALDAAEPARFALLGLLYGGPRHGYDLARSFAAAAPLGEVVHLTASHLYALLARLEKDGLIAGQRQESGSRPPRHVYALTDMGRAAVLQWIGEPVDRPRDLLLDFPLKLYVALQINQEQARALVNRQRASMVEYLEALTVYQNQAIEILNGYQSEPSAATPITREDQQFLVLLRAGRIARTRALLEWLEQCAEELPRLAGALTDLLPT